MTLTGRRQRRLIVSRCFCSSHHAPAAVRSGESVSRPSHAHGDPPAGARRTARRLRSGCGRAAAAAARAASRDARVPSRELAKRVVRAGAQASAHPRATRFHTVRRDTRHRAAVQAVAVRAGRHPRARAARAVGFGIAHVRRSRRAWRAYRAGSAASPRCTRTTDEAAPFQPKALSTRAEGAPAKHSREMRSISRG